MISTNVNKYSKSFICTDKQNNAEIVNIVDSTGNVHKQQTLPSDNSHSQQFKRNYISQKSLPLNAFNDSKGPMTIESLSHAPTYAPQCSTTTNSYQPVLNPIPTNILNSTHNSNTLNSTLGNTTVNSSLNSNYSSMNHSRTEENLRELAQKMNADQVKRNLNCEIPDETMNNTKNQDFLKAKSISTVSINGHKIVPTHLGKDEPSKDKEDVEQKDKEAKQYCFREVENKNLIRLLSNTIIDYVKQKEKETTPYESFARHNIPTNLRAQMVDWMIEVLSSYKCSEQTFFLAVRVMDLYFQRTTKIHEVSDLHLVGVTSMFIACQYEEIYPMKLSVVHQKIAHQKLSMESIKKKESEILQAIQFNLIGTTPFQITSHILLRCNLKELLEPKVFTYLEKICIYLSKMILYDYDLICQKEYCLLGGALIYVAYKIIEQIDSGFVAVEKIKEVMKILSIPNDPLIETAAQILNLAKNFDKLFPNLENLKKFNIFSLEDSEKQQ